MQNTLTKKGAKTKVRQRIVAIRYDKRTKMFWYPFYRL